MKVDSYGQIILSESDLCNIYLRDPEKILSTVITDSDIQISDILELKNVPKIVIHQPSEISVAEFDAQNQTVWHMPEEYKTFDVAKYVLDRCSTQEELQRAGMELLLFQDRDMFDMLRYLKYLVDTMRKNNIVWGVGRGSSVSSFVLFLLEVHRINSLYYDLSIEEFLK